MHGGTCLAGAAELAGAGGPALDPRGRRRHGRRQRSRAPGVRRGLRMPREGDGMDKQDVAMMGNATGAKARARCIAAAYERVTRGACVRGA